MLFLIFKKTFLFFCILSVSIDVYASEDIAIMGIIKDKVLLRINGNHYTIKKGEYAVEGVELISVDKARKSVMLKINNDIKTFRLGHGTNTAAYKVHLSADKSGIYRATGKINNKPVSYIVDTGATFVSLNSHTATSLRIDYKNNSKTAFSETANGVVPVFLVKLSSVEIGSIKLKNVDAAIHEGDFPKTVLLGMSFLNQLSMKREGSILSLQLR